MVEEALGEDRVYRNVVFVPLEATRSGIKGLWGEWPIAIYQREGNGLAVMSLAVASRDSSPWFFDLSLSLSWN